MNKHLPFLVHMLQEADAYISMETIESCAEKGLSLHHVPIQPLYFALKTLPPEQVAGYLPKLSREQKSVLLDLDLWEKDDLAPAEFEHWVDTYAICPDDHTRQNFARSPSFGLYLKSCFNIWTFDQEDPRYPEHDHYFLTEDNLLLFEFDARLNGAEAAQLLIKDLYSNLGVDRAYAHLFKYLSETPLNLVEEEYLLKKGRLGDIGMVDYYDALAIKTPFPNTPAMDNFIRKKDPAPPFQITDFSKQQRLDRVNAMVYTKGLNSLHGDLAKVACPRRKDVLQFNFIRLINATAASEFRKGPLAVNRANKKTKSLLELGHGYLERKRTAADKTRLFDCFDFCEVYKIGNTLVHTLQKKIRAALKRSKVKKNPGFLGKELSFLLEELPIDRHSDWLEFEDQASRFEKMLPFIDEMYATFDNLVERGDLSNRFYLNYNVDQIDFESIIISSFANFTLGNYDLPDGKKLGVTIKEHKTFSGAILEGSPSVLKKGVDSKIGRFQTNFGLDRVPGFKGYMKKILGEHLEGHQFETLNDEDYRHVGGPIILNRAPL